jgi:hypothetical protein
MKGLQNPVGHTQISAPYCDVGQLLHSPVRIKFILLYRPRNMADGSLKFSGLATRDSEM